MATLPGKFSSGTKTALRPQQEKLAQTLIYQADPILALLQSTALGKDHSIPSNDTLKIPIIYNKGASIGGAFGKVRQAQAASDAEAFLIDTYYNQYGFVSVEYDTMIRGMSLAGKDPMALKKTMMLSNYGFQTAAKFFSRSIGKIATGGVSTDTVTLTRKEDVRNFERGTVIQFSTTISGGTVKDEATVERVNPGARTVTFTEDVSGFAAADDFLFLNGEYDFALKSFDDYVLPAAPSSSDVMFGLDRFKDVERLGGVRIDVSTSGSRGRMDEEKLFDIGEEMFFRQMDCSHLIVSPRDANSLMKQGAQRVSYDVGLRSGVVQSYQGITVPSFLGVENKPITILVSAHQENGKAKAINLDTWGLVTATPAPVKVEEQGMEDESRHECRYLWIMQYVCNSPGKNAQITLYS